MKKLNKNKLSVLKEYAEQHHGKYDYSKEFKPSTEKVKISCPRCGK